MLLISFLLKVFLINDIGHKNNQNKKNEIIFMNNNFVAPAYQINTSLHPNNSSE